MDRLVQDLHAAISRRNWHDTEVAANAIRDSQPRDIVPAPDQTNAEVSDERLREIEQAILLLRPAGNIAYHMKQGIVSPNAGGAPYEFGRINDAVNAAIKLLSSARRSVTSQASGEPVAYRYVPKEQRGTDDFIWRFAAHHPGDGKWKVDPLYASPSKRVERLEAINECVKAVETERDHHRVMDSYSEGKRSAFNRAIIALQALQGGRS